MTDNGPKGDDSFEFPAGNKSDKFLISTADGPAYIITRQELEDASKSRIADLKKLKAAYVAGGPPVLIDLITGIIESTRMWPFNR